MEVTSPRTQSHGEAGLGPGIVNSQSSAPSCAPQGFPDLHKWWCCFMEEELGPREQQNLGGPQATEIGQWALRAWAPFIDLHILFTKHSVDTYYVSALFKALSGY